MGSIPGVKQLAPLVLRLMFQSPAPARSPPCTPRPRPTPAPTPGRRAPREPRHVGPARLSRLAHDEALAGKLWEISEDLTGVRYDWETSATGFRCGA